MRFALTIWFGILLSPLPLLKAQGQDSVLCVSEGDTAVLSCGITLTGGLTVRLATWRKLGPPDVVVAQYLIGTSTPGPDYTGRATVNDTGFLLLEHVTQADVGTYRCDATLSDLSSLPVVDEKVELRPTDPPVMRGVTVSATKKTDTSAEVEWNQLQSNSPCEGVLIYRVDYKLGETTSTWNDVEEFLPGSVSGNNTLSLTVTGLKTKGTYIFGVRANNSVGASSRVVSNSVNIPGVSESDLGTPIGFGVGLGVPALIAVVGGVTYIWWRISKGLFRLRLSPLPDRKMEVQWTAPSGYEGARYQVAYKRKDSDDDWTRSSDVSTNDPPHYKYTVTFPQHGQDRYECYELCVFLLLGEDEKQSDIEGVIIEDANASTSSRPVSPLHDNNAPKTDSHVVFMTTDGRSPPLRLDPIVNEQNPAVKKEKKKKKRKKVNKVNASDEETKPEV